MTYHISTRMKNWLVGCCSNGMLFSVLGLSAAYRYVIGQSETFGRFILETSIWYVARDSPLLKLLQTCKFLPVAFWYRIKWKGRNLLNAKASTSHMLHSVFTFFWSFLSTSKWKTLASHGWGWKLQQLFAEQQIRYLIWHEIDYSSIH